MASELIYPTLKLATLVMYLLAVGASVNYRDKNGMTPLDHAEMSTRAGRPAVCSSMSGWQ
jgi:ankyrin repeat protein